jgi:hypothetical protein
MERIVIGEWEIEYDRNKTIDAYNKSETLTEDCNCISCQNYYNASCNLNNNIIKFFENFGININKPAEIYDVGLYENGKILYNGFYHIIGTIIKGKDVWENIASEEENETYHIENMYKVAEDFEVGFTYQTALINKNFIGKVIQMEISLWVPWIMDDKEYIKSMYYRK